MLSGSVASAYAVICVRSGRTALLTTIPVGGRPVDVMIPD